MNIGKAQVVALADELIRQRTEQDATEKNNNAMTLTGLMRHSRLFDLVYTLYHDMPLFAAGERKQRISPALKRFVVKKNIQMLANIRDNFPEASIHLIHLPERHEVVSGRYDRDVREHVEGLGVAYFPALQQCGWSEDMYHRYDLHPNEEGYATITRCVKDYLSRLLLETPSGRD
jgi:hypothetical protein